MKNSNNKSQINFKNNLFIYTLIILGTSILFFLCSVINFLMNLGILINWEHRKELSTIQWKSGDVIIIDNYNYSGSHYYSVEWISSGKEKIILSKPDRDLPSVKINEADELVIKWKYYEGDNYENEWMFFIYQNPENEPASRSTIYLSEYDCSETNLVIVRLNSWDNDELKCYEDSLDCDEGTKAETNIWVKFHKDTLDRCNIKVIWDGDKYKVSQ